MVVHLPDKMVSPHLYTKQPLMQQQPNDPLLKGPKSRQEIAAEYGIHARTLMRKLKALPLALPPGVVLPQDQKRIYEALGPPIVNLNTPPPRKKEE